MLELNRAMHLDMLLIISLLLMFCVSRSQSEIVSSPGIQRKHPGDTSTFQWTVASPLAGCTVYNFTTGSELPLSDNANFTVEEKQGIVTLNIWKIQLKDAGNYSLHLNMGTSTLTDTGALLFVYGYGQSSIVQASGSIPATQGQTVELNCTLVSSSLPVSYRPSIIYFWCILRFHSCLRNISRPAVFQSGDVLTGYSIKNDGRTLVIHSVQYTDTQGVYCRAHEEGSMYISHSPRFHLQLRHQPYTTIRHPSSKTFNADVNEQVSLSFNGVASPQLTSHTNWSFVNRTGHQSELPPSSVSSFNLILYRLSLTFNLTSDEFYGCYFVTVTNVIGSTTETFEVLPKGPPDAPSNFRILFVSHVLIEVQWTVMADNGLQQTIFLQTNALHNDTAVAKWNKTYPINYFNITNNQQISDNIEPETDYEVRIWSANALGSSNVTKLTTETLKQMILYISAKTISFNGSQAIINYTTSYGNLTSMYITCCVELTGTCLSYSFYVSGAHQQVVFNNLPKGNEYVFDFTAYAGIPRKYDYYAAMVKGVKVSRTGNSESDEHGLNPFAIAVIVLGVLLGLALLALIGCAALFLAWKHRANYHSMNTSIQADRGLVSSIESSERDSQMTDTDVVSSEAVDVNASRDEVHYTSVEELDAGAKVEQP